jgi:hypothetical protein
MRAFHRIPVEDETAIGGLVTAALAGSGYVQGRCSVTAGILSVPNVTDVGAKMYSFCAPLVLNLCRLVKTGTEHSHSPNG